MTKAMIWTGFYSDPEDAEYALNDEAFIYV
jgi:hypothetical protein